MLIGEVAEQAGVPSQTIRFYEREGLLPPATRGGNGYRVYDGTTLTRLSFIRAAQSAGLTLAEIRSIVEVRDNGDVPCAHVTALLAARLDAVAARMRELEALTAELQHLLERSRTLDPGDCTDADVCHIIVEPT